MALQPAWLAQKRNDLQLPGECLQGEEYDHPMLVKPNGRFGSISGVQRQLLGAILAVLKVRRAVTRKSHAVLRVSVTY
jgi:hypothetical protein